ncbi:MAG: YcaO-like family protein, partial [Gloeotrichia echinulata HAB0833]
EIQQLNLVRVWCITTSQERLIPEILVSLEGLPDHQLFPSADTSGCAVHSDPNKCTDNALLEFCERQASFASWYGPWTTTEITHSKITSSHLEAIANCGRIRLFDIGGPFGVPILLSIFQSESSSSLVKFAAGLGAAWDRREAITKSLNELYQLYELTYFSAKGEIRDPHNLLQHNCHESAVNWPFIGQQPNSKISELTYLSIEMPERAGLIERLEKSGIRVQIFLDRLQLPSASLYVAKVLSPDAFLSSMGKLHNNYNNRFSQTSFINSDKSRPCILF